MHQIILTGTQASQCGLSGSVILVLIFSHKFMTVKLWFFLYCFLGVYRPYTSKYSHLSNFLGLCTFGVCFGTFILALVPWSESLKFMNVLFEIFLVKCLGFEYCISKFNLFLSED